MPATRIEIYHVPLAGQLGEPTNDFLTAFWAKNASLALDIIPDYFCFLRPHDILFLPGDEIFGERREEQLKEKLTIGISVSTSNYESGLKSFFRKLLMDSRHSPLARKDIRFYAMDVNICAEARTLVSKNDMYHETKGYQFFTYHVKLNGQAEFILPEFDDIFSQLSSKSEAKKFSYACQIAKKIHQDAWPLSKGIRHFFEDGRFDLEDVVRVYSRYFSYREVMSLVLSTKLPAITKKSLAPIAEKIFSEQNANKKISMDKWFALVRTFFNLNNKKVATPDEQQAALQKTRDALMPLVKNRLDQSALENALNEWARFNHFVLPPPVNEGASSADVEIVSPPRGREAERSKKKPRRSLSAEPVQHHAPTSIFNSAASLVGALSAISSASSAASSRASSPTVNVSDACSSSARISRVHSSAAMLGAQFAMGSFSVPTSPRRHDHHAQLSQQTGGDEHQSFNPS